MVQFFLPLDLRLSGRAGFCSLRLTLRRLLSAEVGSPGKRDLSFPNSDLASAWDPVVFILGTGAFPFEGTEVPLKPFSHEEVPSKPALVCFEGSGL